MAKFFREPNRRQLHLLPQDMMEWLPDDDMVHLVVDVVEGMDLRKFKRQYKTTGAGQAPYSPAMMLAILIYAYSGGIRSSRKIETLCRRDVAFRMIVGDQSPDHTSLARFRQRHLKDMQVVFTNVLALCREMGLGKLGAVFLDGTKVKGNASLDANRNRKHLEREVAKMLRQAEQTDADEDALYGESRGDELPQELRRRDERLARLKECQEVLEQREANSKPPPKKRCACGKSTGKTTEPKANTTDPESRVMKARGGWVQGYNGQMAVTEDQIILAAEVSNAANDVGQLKPMLESIWGNLALVEEDEPELGLVVADAGYFSEANVALETEDCHLLIAPRSRRKMTEVENDEWGEGPMGAREKMTLRLASEDGRALYNLRGQSSEPVFGQVKEIQDGGSFSCRGLAACDGEWKLQAAVHNLRKMHSKCVRNQQKGDKTRRK